MRALANGPKCMNRVAVPIHYHGHKYEEVFRLSFPHNLVYKQYPQLCAIMLSTIRPSLYYLMLCLFGHWRFLRCHRRRFLNASLFISSTNNDSNNNFRNSSPSEQLHSKVQPAISARE